MNAIDALEYEPTYDHGPHSSTFDTSENSSSMINSNNIDTTFDVLQDREAKQTKDLFINRSMMIAYEDFIYTPFQSLY